MTAPSKTPTTKMLVELDSILDTRLGVLLDVAPDVVPAILAKDYHNRLWDVFPGVDFLAYQQRYQSRDKAILKNSWMTPMADMMTDFVKKTLQQTLQTPFHRVPKIDLNIYPYVLTDDEASVILKAAATKTANQCDIEIVSFSPEDLNPVFLKNNYEAVMMYDYQVWLETHSKNGLWKKYSCPQVIVFAPLMMKNPETYDSNLKVESTYQDFVTLSKAMSLYADIQFLPLEAYCWKFNPHKAPTPSTQKDAKDEGDEVKTP